MSKYTEHTEHSGLPKKYGYARVSALHQDLTSQIQTLENEGCQEIFSEKFTGTKMDRPELQKLLNILKTGDTLVITKLDRIARTSREGTELIENLSKQGIKVHVLNMGVVDNTPTGKLILTIMLAFAEFERDMIVERTQEGRAIARQKPDYREGRPKKYTKIQLNHAMQLLENHSYTEVAEITGISKSTLIREMRRRRAKDHE